MVGSVGFALRKSKRVLRAGPRRDLIVESLAVAVSLLAELADPTPEFVATGGMNKFVKLACPGEDKSIVIVESLEDAPVDSSEMRYDDNGTVGSDYEYMNDAPLIESEVLTEVGPEQVDAALDLEGAPMHANDFAINCCAGRVDAGSGLLVYTADAGVDSD